MITVDRGDGYILFEDECDCWLRFDLALDGRSAVAEGFGELELGLSELETLHAWLTLVVVPEPEIEEPTDASE